MKSDKIIINQYDTVVEFTVNRVDDKFDGKEVFWHSMIMEIYPKADTEMITTIKFNTIDASELEKVAQELLKLATQMKIENEKQRISTLKNKVKETIDNAESLGFRSEEDKKILKDTIDEWIKSNVEVSDKQLLNPEWK